MNGNNYNLLSEFLTEGYKQTSVQPILFNNEYIIDHQEKIRFYKSRIETIIKDIDNIQSKSVLEFGCNSGFDTLTLARLGVNVTSIDMIERMIDMIAFLMKKENLKNITPICSSFNSFIKQNKKQFNILLALHIMSYSDAKEMDLNIISGFVDTTYFDLSPDAKYEPYDSLDKKKYQEDSINKFCDECLTDFNTTILESEHTYIVKATRR